MDSSKVKIFRFLWNIKDLGLPKQMLKCIMHGVKFVKINEPVVHIDIR